MLIKSGACLDVPEAQSIAKITRSSTRHRSNSAVCCYAHSTGSTGIGGFAAFLSLRTAGTQGMWPTQRFTTNGITRSNWRHLLHYKPPRGALAFHSFHNRASWKTVKQTLPHKCHAQRCPEGKILIVVSDVRSRMYRYVWFSSCM